MKLNKPENGESYINILVSRKKIEWVAHAYTLTAHAKMQLVRRDSKYDFNLEKAILNSPLAWKTKSGCVAIALDLYNYIVVAIEGDKATVITAVNTKDTCSVIDKFLIEYREFQTNEKH